METVSTAEAPARCDLIVVGCLSRMCSPLYCLLNLPAVPINNPIINLSIRTAWCDLIYRQKHTQIPQIQPPLTGYDSDITLPFFLPFFLCYLLPNSFTCGPQCQWGLYLWICFDISRLYSFQIQQNTF